jgi:hypothetical protein
MVQGTLVSSIKPSSAAPDSPVIIIEGLCDDQAMSKRGALACKTVITQAQFEKVIDAVQPGMPLRARREFALDYIDFLKMSKKAEQLGLDKSVTYEEQMRLARIQVLSQDLKKTIQEKASQISQKEIEEYYRNNISRFENAEVQRIYIPKTQQLLPEKALSDVSRETRLHESEQTMKEEADSLHARAMAREEFIKLQADAYQFAGIKNVLPNTDMRIRRSSLPPNQVVVMDLRPGTISSVFDDANGFVIYKIMTKDTLSLNQAQEEIKAALRSQRVKDEMQDIEDSATYSLDASYFSR